MLSNRLLTYTVLAGLAVLLGSCGAKQAPQRGSRDAAASGESRRDQVEVSRVEIPYFSADGKMKWLISAERAMAETRAGTTDVEGVRCDLFEGGVQVASLKARNTHIDYEKRRLVMAGGVAVTFARQGMEAECRRFRWNWDDGAFIADGGIEFRKGGARGRGDRLQGSTRDTTFHLF